MATQKVILAYGDSLTYGHDADNQQRHAYEDRWPTVLEKGLGGAARVIAEGLGGRTTAFDDWSAAADRNGVTVLPTLLSSHTPLDLVILFLGTNDLKPFINGTALGAAFGMRRLVEIVRTHPYAFNAPAPKIIIVSPPQVIATTHADLGPMFEGAIAQSQRLAGHYSRAAEELGTGFFDAAKVATPTPVDGIHLDAANTRAIGEGLVPLVKETLGL
jgi:lysophospholipase L1-like esterase